MAKLVDPAGVSRPPAKSLALRLTTLAGIRLGLLDNAKPNADAVLGAIAERLRAEQAVSEIVRYRKKNPGMGATAEVLDALADCDAVLLGTSD